MAHLKIPPYKPKQSVLFVLCISQRVFKSTPFPRLTCWIEFAKMFSNPTLLSWKHTTNGSFAISFVEKKCPLQFDDHLVHDEQNNLINAC